MQTDQSREPNLEELKKSRVGDQSEIQKDWDVTVTFVSVVDVPGAGVPGTVPGTGTVRYCRNDPKYVPGTSAVYLVRTSIRYPSTERTLLRVRKSTERTRLDDFQGK